MKKLIFLSTFILFITTNSKAQLDFVLEDIHDSLLASLIIPDADSPEANFQNFAVELFRSGEKIPDSLLKDESNKFIGVCLLSLDGFKYKAPEFNLYRMQYGDFREKDFHKSIYYGRGHEGIGHFFVTWDFEVEHQMILHAVDTLLNYSPLPNENLAFQFTNTHELPKDRFYEYCNSTGTSIVIPSTSPVYIRKSGNFIVMLEGRADKAIFEEWEELKVTPYFIDHLVSISVLMINPETSTLKTAFDQFNSQ